MVAKLILWSFLIIPWLTLLFMKKEGFKRFIPVTIFTSLLVTIIFEIAYKYKWWEILVTIVPWGDITNVSYAYGVFFVGTIWIFYLTFNKFWVYLVTNIIVDGIDAFIIRPFMQSVNIIHYDKISKFNLFAVMVTLALVSYGFQYWYDDQKH